MIMDTLTTKPNNSTVVVSALVTSGTTRLLLFRNCSEYMVSTKMDVNSKPGASTVKQRALTSTKCDIFATTTLSTISGDLTPKCQKKNNFRNKGGNGKFLSKLMNLLHNQSTTTIFKAVSGGRVSQFLAVFVHLACEDFFVKFFLHGRPKSPLIV